MVAARMAYAITLLKLNHQLFLRDRTKQRSDHDPMFSPNQGMVRCLDIRFKPLINLQLRDRGKN